MTKQNIQYVVKVLSGVNEGATADLQDTSGVVIGRSVGCDIIFNGANVADRHVAVELDGGRIRLTPLAQPVYIDGRDVGSNEIILQPNQLVNVGVVDFTIAEKNQPWPDYDSTTKKLVVDQNASISGVTRVGDGLNAKASLLGNPWLWIAAVIMLLANIHYLTQQYGGIPGLLGFSETTDQKVNSVIRVDKYPGLYVKRINGQLTQIEGYVSTMTEKALVENEVAEFGDSVVSHILVDSEIEDNARKIAQSLGENEITFSTIEHGRLKASGLTDNRSKWMNIKENIRSDVRGVTSIHDDDVRNLNEMYVVLERKIAAEKFSKRIDIKLNSGTIVVKGRLTKEEKARWLQIKEEFLGNSFYPFKFREIIRAPDADIKLSIRSVSVGDIPFIISKEGNKYFNGSHVGSGYYIESINDDHILLNNNNIVFPVYFGQEKE
jgi:type III secretion system YscD/HrpQ family protein